MVCLVREENIVEDEYHFLCVCKRYDDLRQQDFIQQDFQ